jgi:hypothetical protein
MIKIVNILEDLFGSSLKLKPCEKFMKKSPTEYMKLPWEVEANNNMRGLYTQFINSKWWKDLRGKDQTLDYIMDNI